MSKNKRLALKQLEQLQILFTPEAFIAEVRAGHSKVVKLFLEAGMSPDTASSSYYVPGSSLQNHNPALLVAAEMGHVEIVKLMWEVHSELKGQAFVVASAYGHAELVKELICLGANSHPNNIYDAMAMYAAAGNNQVEIVKLLIESGVNADVTSQKITHGRTALMEATLEENLELIEYLIQAGANVDLEDAQGVTALMEASGNNCFNSAKILLKNKCNMKIINKNGQTALDIAIQEGHSEIIDLLKGYSSKDSIP